MTCSCVSNDAAPAPAGIVFDTPLLTERIRLP